MADRTSAQRGTTHRPAMKVGPARRLSRRPGPGPTPKESTRMTTPSQPPYEPGSNQPQQRRFDDHRVSPYWPSHPTPDPLPTPPPAPKKKSRLRWVLGGIAVFAALICIGGIAIVANAPDTSTTPDTPAGRAVAAAPTAGTPAPEVTTIVEPEPAAPAVPKDITLTGRGDKLLKLKLDRERGYVATITYSGGSNFVVTSLDSAGGQVDLLVNEIGKYAGSRPIQLRQDEAIAALKVESSGSWKIVIRDLSKAPQFKGKASGKGSAVYLVPAGTLGPLATAKITYSGQHNFVVTSYGGYSDLLVNEIGRYSGEVLLGADTLVIEIQASGAWTMQLT